MALSTIPGVQGSPRDGLPLNGASGPGLWSNLLFAVERHTSMHFLPAG